MSSCCDIVFNLFDASGRLVVAGAKDYLSLEYQRSENEVGAFEIVLPGYYHSLDIGPDWIFEFYRSMTDNSEIVDGGTCWFVRRFEQIYDESQCGLLIIGGHDTIGLLRRRVIAWFAPNSAPEGFNGTGFKTAPADDAIREIFQENFGSGVNGPGDIPPSASSPVGFPNPTTYSSASREMTRVRFAAGEVGNGVAPVVSQEIAWQPALQVMQALSNSAAQQDIRRKVTFDIVYTPSGGGSIGSFDFNVWVGTRGRIRSDLTFSPHNGSLRNAKLVVDHTDEANWIHVAGSGNGDSRIVVGVVDEDRSHGPFYPIEAFVDRANAETDSEDALIGLGQSELATRREKISLTGEVAQLPGFEFGMDYSYGDIIQATVDEITFDSSVSNFRVTARDGDCVIEIQFTAEKFPL